MTSKEYFSKLEEVLNENNLHILLKQNSDDDSIYHFFIKELPKWKFGIWFTFCSDEHKDQIASVEIFTRHIDDLDKFKPSRSFFVEHESIEPNTNYSYLSTIDYVIGVIKLIKHYPLLAYLVSYNMTWKCVSNNMLWEYVKLRVANKKRELERWYETDFKYTLTYLQLRRLKKKLLNFRGVTNVHICDRNSREAIWFPRYEMIIYVDEEQIDSKVIGYVYYCMSGKLRQFTNVNIIFGSSDKTERFDYEHCLEDYFDAYGWKAKLFGKKKYTNKMKNDSVI